LDVRLVQLALSKPQFSFKVIADGVLGRYTSDAINAFQNREDLPNKNGVVDSVVFAALGL
jgi:hypothetical protein